MRFAFVNLSARFALLRFTIGIVLLTLASHRESLLKPAWIMADSPIFVKTFSESLRVFQPNVTFVNAFKTVLALNRSLFPRLRMPTPLSEFETLSANVSFFTSNVLSPLTS